MIQKILLTLSIIGLTLLNPLFAQNAVQAETVKDSTEKVDKTILPTELKTGIDKFYIINDQPVSYSTFINHLLMKKEEQAETNPLN
jgi:hypothetical protein